MQHLYPIQIDDKFEDCEFLNPHELTSILALIAYVADCNNVSVYVVREMLKTYSGINDIMELPRQSFDQAVRFLVDARIDLLLN